MTNNRLDITAMKKMGMIQQKQKDFFAMRLHVVGGDLNTEQLQRIIEVADKYGKGQVHLSTRQGLEIHNIHYTKLETARKSLEEINLKMGACGPRIRIIVACPGNDTCRWGIINTKKMAKELDEKYFRKETPHKFKLAVTGCPNNCAKATENDIGIMGGILPEWIKDECSKCNLCIYACPKNAIYKENDQYKLNEDKCIYCSICTSSCPSEAWIRKKEGYILHIGGTMGKSPRLASKLCGLIEEKPRLNILIEKAVQYYKKHGQKKERFGHMIDRIGLEEIREVLLDGV
ncbi:MAG: sulfite reductase subunit beta [bacterium]|nr:sulfite reductase subunit beta [bacterium]